MIFIVSILLTFDDVSFWRSLFRLWAGFNYESKFVYELLSKNIIVFFRDMRFLT